MEKSKLIKKKKNEQILAKNDSNLNLTFYFTLFQNDISLKRNFLLYIYIYI